MMGAEWVIGVNNGDLDRVFGELTDPEMRVENRSASVFPHRSAAELRSSYEQLNALVASSRSWNSAECWLSSNVVVARHERQASGPDAEQYSWTRLYVFETVDGRCTGLCAFELDDEAAAFAYAEDRVSLAEQR